MHFHGWAIGCFAHPYVKVFAFACFEEQHIVAVVELGYFVELIELGLGVELCIFSAVWKKRVKVVEKMPMPDIVSTSHIWNDGLVCL